jgi:4-hydroxy-tetrahydrodipicolinate synthase
MIRNKLKGTGVALVTPFHKDGSIDFKGLKKLVNRCIEGKVEYLVPLGTTGESVTLTKDERRAVLDFVIEVNNGRVPVVLGLGGNNTREIVNSLSETNFDGVDAILSVSPYYNRPSQRGIYLHYMTIANSSPVPVILYNVPSRTGSNIDAETTLSLAHDNVNIIGVKEASGSMERVMRIVKGKHKDFLVISGDDLLALPIIACGGDGVISVIANAMPKDFSEMVRAALEGNYDKAKKLHYKLLDITRAIFVDGSPAGVKGLLSVLDVCSEYLRLPLVSVGKATMNRFEEMLMEKV